MGSRFVRPSTTLLTLANGDTLTVKTRLTHGERSAAEARRYDVVEGKMVLRPERITTVIVSMYLIDWTLTDERGERVPIFQESLDTIERILGSLSEEDFDEIFYAIQAHERAQDAAREQEKKRSSASGASPTSPSPSVPAGELIGSVS